MNALLKIGIVGLAAMTLAACASDAPSDPNAGKIATKYPALNAELQPRYAKLAADEAEEGDTADAAEFNAKAADAAAGFEVLPNAMGTRAVEADKVAGLSDARARLMQKYTEGYATSQPADLAEAQTKWDCWYQEQEEGWQLLHIYRCRDDFEAAMAKMVPAPVAPAPKAAAPAPAMPAKDYTVYFRFDQSSLTNLAKGRLQTAIGDAMKRKTPAITVGAHTDTSGSEQYNQALSNARAKTIVDFLVSNGVPASVITAVGYGESQPKYSTADGQKTPKDRRGEITVSGQ